MPVGDERLGPKKVIFIYFYGYLFKCYTNTPVVYSNVMHFPSLSYFIYL